MTKRVTMTDVAREAGVSLMTVSRVVNNKDDVNPTTRQNVLNIINQLGYRPSSIARGLVTQRTGTLGLIVPDIENPFYSGMVRGAENQAYAEDYSVFLCNTNEDPERELAVLQSLQEKQIDGLMLCSSRLSNETLRQIVEHFPAVVLVARRLEDDSVGTVLIDDHSGGRIGTEHLLRTGHRIIGFLAGPPVSHSSRYRHLGYREALESNGIAYNPVLVAHCSPIVEGGHRAALDLLSSHPEISALFCHNDLVAVGALQACHEIGRRVPDDCAIVGFDNIPLASLVTPPLTTCHVNRHALGAQAMRLLLEQILIRTGPTHEIVLRPELVVRASAPYFV